MKSLSGIFAALLFASSGSLLAADQSSRFAQLPPLAEVMAAGPRSGVTTPNGQDAISLRLEVAIHSVDFDRITITDTATGKVVAEAANPKLTDFPHRHPADPSVQFRVWEGISQPVALTASTPEWLLAPGDSTMDIEIRLINGTETVFSHTQQLAFPDAAKRAFVAGLGPIGTAAKAQPSGIDMASAADLNAPFIAAFGERAKAKDLDGLLGMADERTLARVGPEKMSELLRELIFPAFADFQSTKPYENVTRNPTFDGRIGLRHYTYFVNANGDSSPYFLSVIDTGNGPRFYDFGVGCIKGKHPRIAPCD